MRYLRGPLRDWKHVAVAVICWTVTAQPGRIVDGDTFYASMAIWPAHYTIDVIRVLGVDTPELKGETKPAAEAAKAFTSAWLQKGEVTVTVCKRDSFGRLLGRVTRGDEDLALMLIRNGMGIERLK